MSSPISPLGLDTCEFAPGASAAAAELERDLERVAASDVTVLIEGESGSGKGVAARRLHALSPRARAPLVEVSLASLTPTLLEAELFGHTEGSFTGAFRSRRGRFVLAQGGTLLLDGVESLAEAVQVKLLRVLQERVVEPLGSEEALPIDVRVVATSGLDLAGLVRSGRFREDLYYRLAVVTLRVPPLRARMEDLPLLVESISRRVAHRSRVSPRTFAPAAFARLARHSWPGNVRELENAIERVLVLAPSGGFQAAPAPVALEELAFLDAEIESETARLARSALALGLGVEEMGLAMIEEALAEERGNVSAAARRIGMTRRALEYRRRRGIEERSEPSEPAP